MATVRTAPAPAQQFPIVAPPLPVQNGAQTGSKVSEDFTGDTDMRALETVPILYKYKPIISSLLAPPIHKFVLFGSSWLPLSMPLQIIQIAPMPVVQSQLPQGGAVHPATPFPVTVGTAAVVAPGSAPSQAVLLPPAPTR